MYPLFRRHIFPSSSFHLSRVSRNSIENKRLRRERKAAGFRRVPAHSSSAPIHAFLRGGGGDGGCDGGFGGGFGSVPAGVEPPRLLLLFQCRHHLHVRPHCYHHHDHRHHHWRRRRRRRHRRDLCRFHQSRHQIRKKNLKTNG